MVAVTCYWKAPRLMSMNSNRWEKSKLSRRLNIHSNWSACKHQIKKNKKNKMTVKNNHLLSTTMMSVNEHLTWLLNSVCNYAVWLPFDDRDHTHYQIWNATAKPTLTISVCMCLPSEWLISFPNCRLYWAELHRHSKADWQLKPKSSISLSMLESWRVFFSPVSSVTVHKWI